MANAPLSSSEEWTRKESPTPLNLLQLDAADRLVLQIADIRDNIQKKTFTKWVNKHLHKVNENVTDIFEDLRDGSRLLMLFEVLSKQSLPRERGKLRFHKLQNVKAALDFLNYKGIKFVNIRPDEIVDGNPKLTLGLIWTTILHFQVSEVQLPGQEELNAKQSLLLWSQLSVDGYPDVQVEDFSKSWKDGKAFLCIIHRNRPDLVDMRRMHASTPRENLETAFTIAEEQLGVTKLLDPEDMEVPDERSVITYVSSLYKAFPKPVLSATVGPKDNSTLKTKLAEYEAVGRALLLWLRQQRALASDRPLPTTLVEVKALLTELNKFRIEDIPNKLADKRKLEILFHEIENISGRFPFDDEIHIDKIASHWDDLTNAISDRDAALVAEQARLQRLQKVAEKVHKDTKTCEEYLYEVEKKVAEEEGRHGVLHHAELRQTLDAAHQILAIVGNHTDALLSEAQGLRDGQYHQAESMYRRVASIRQRMDGLSTRLSAVASKARLSAAPGVRTSTASTASSTSSNVRRSEDASRLRAAGTALPVLSPGSMSGLDMLNVCIDWMERKRAELDQLPADFGYDLRAVEAFSSRVRADQQDVTALRTRLDMAFAARSTLPYDELAAFSQRTAKAEIAYSSLLSLANQRLRSSEGLLQFCRDASEELRWLEAARRSAPAAAAGGSGAPAEQRLSVATVADSWDPARLRQQFEELMTGLQLHEETFNRVQDRGEDLTKCNQLGAATVQRYLTAMQDEWGWLLQVAGCLETHQKQALTAQKFFADVDECRRWLEDQLAFLQQPLDKGASSTAGPLAGAGSLPLHSFADRYVQRVKDIGAALAHCEQAQLKELESRSAAVVPGRRLLLLGQTMPGLQPGSVQCIAVATYRRGELSFVKGDRFALKDAASNPATWIVQDRQGSVVEVPAICLAVCPPDPAAKTAFEELRTLCSRAVDAAKSRNFHVKVDTALTSLSDLENPEAASRPTDVAKREAVLRSLIKDMEQLLSSPEAASADDALLVRLRGGLLRCKDAAAACTTAAGVEMHVDARPESRRFSAQVSGQPQVIDDETALKRLTTAAYSLQTLDQTLRLYHEEAVPRDLDSLQKLVVAHKAFDISMQSCSAELEDLQQATLSSAVAKRLQGFVNKADDMYRLSAMYTQRLKLAEGIIATMDHINQVASMLESILAKQDLWDVEDKAAISSRLEELSAEVSKRQPLIDGLNADMTALTDNIASGARPAVGCRQGVAPKRQDLIVLSEDIAKLKHRWKALRSMMASRQTKPAGTLSSWQDVSSWQEGGTAAGKELTVQATYASLYDRSPTLDRLQRSGGTTRSIQNKLEELYEELSRDLQQELKWSALAMQTLTREETLVPDDPAALQRRLDEFAALAEDVREHQQLARAVVQQNEQLREQQPPIVSPQEAYDQDVLHSQLLANLEKISKEVDWRSRHLTVCQDDLVKVNSELHKFEAWLREAEALLKELRERSSKLLSLKDASQRCQAFHSEVITRQADMRFLNMASQKFAADSKSYQARLITFRAELQGARASVLLESDGESSAGGIRDKVGAMSQCYQRLLANCEEESSKLARVNDCQRLFAEAARKLEDWVVMAERNLSAFKREPVRTDLPGLQEQLDRVREFAATAMVQEKLVDELRTRGSEYEGALAAVGATTDGAGSGGGTESEAVSGGLAAEDARETVEDLACRHGLVVAEATARCNVLQTAMVQAEGVTASLDGLLAWVSSAESSLAGMKPISLIRENFDDQVSELRAFEADVESHRRSLAAINASAAEVLQSCHPKMAALIQTKLAEVNARAEAVASRSKERSRDLQEVGNDLGEFLTLSSGLNDWLQSCADTLAAAERNGNSRGCGSSDLVAASAVQESAVQRIQLDAKGERLAQLESVRSLGRRLKENPKTAQVAAVKEIHVALEQNWATFSEMLGRVDQQARRRGELAARFAELQSDATAWLNSMDQRLDALEPVALDVSVIESQIEAVQPLAVEYEDYATRVNELAELCERCEGSNSSGNSSSGGIGVATTISSLSPKDGAPRHLRLRHVSGSSPRRVKSLSPSSPTEKEVGLVAPSSIDATASGTVGHLQKSDSDSSGISSKKSDSADGVAMQLGDLSEMQRQLLEVTHGYDVIGDRLADRQSELRQTLRGLRTYLTDARQALVFLDSGEAELQHLASGLSTAVGIASPADDGSKDSLQIRRQKCQNLNDQLRDTEPLLKQVRQAAYELTTSRENVPGRIQLEKQIAEIESRWNALREGVARRRQSLATLGASSKSFGDSQTFLKSWLAQKEKMLIALGPLATDPQQGRVQLEQMQVLEDEFGAQQAAYDQFLEAGMHVLEQATPGSELAQVVNQQLDTMSQAWSAVETQMRSRHDSLRHVVVQSADLHDLLASLSEWLAGAEQHLDDASESRGNAAIDHGEDAKREIAELNAVKAEVEAREKTLRTAQELSRKLCETIKQPSAQSELRQKIQAVERPLRDFTRKLDTKMADCRSRAQQGQEFEAVCDDALSWIHATKHQLGDRLLVSAKTEVLRDQLRQHERLAAEITRKKDEIAKLIDRGQKLHRISSAAGGQRSQSQNSVPPPAFVGKLAQMQREVAELSSLADTRVRTLSRSSVQAERFDDSLGKLLAWLDAAEESSRRAAASPPSYARPTVERQLREARSAQEAALTAERELDVVRYLALDYLGSVDADKEGVLERVDEARERWAALRSSVDGRARSLEESFVRLGQQRDTAAQIVALHADIEDRLARHSTLPPSSRLEPTHLDEMKALRQQLRNMKPKVDEVKAAAIQNGEISVEIDGAAVPRSVEAIHADHERLEASVESTLLAAEQAAQRVVALNKSLRAASKALGDMAEAIEAASPIARDAKSVREQMKETQALELSLEDQCKAVESTDAECAALAGAGQLAEPAAARSQVEALGRQASRLRSKVAQRLEQLGTTLEELEKFSSSAVTMLGDLERTLKADAIVRPLAENGDTLKQQQQEFKDFVKKTVEGLQRRVEHVCSSGQQLLKGAATEVDTHAIESTLDALNAKWSMLNERVSERDRRLDIAVLQTGKFKESVRSLTEWMTETEELMKNQRPPSVEYKVAKAQIQEQKLLQKMLVDRSEHMVMVKEIASQIAAHAGSAEKKRVDGEVTELQRRWDELNEKAKQRNAALDKNLGVTKAFHERLEPMLVFVDKLERTHAARPAVAADASALREQLAEQRNTVSTVDSQKAELDAILEMANEHLLTTAQLTSSGRRGSEVAAVEEAQQLSDRLSALKDRFDELSSRSRQRLGNIEEVLPLAERFTKSMQQLQEWIEDKAEPSIAAGYGEGRALEKQLAEIEALHDAVKRDGTILVQAAPGEGCDRVATSLTTMQRQYAAISEKIKKTAEHERTAERMKEELVSNVEEMSNWLGDAGEQLHKVHGVTPDPAALQSQLSYLKGLNEAIGVRRGQLQQLLATGQRLSTDGVVKESVAELGEALNALRQQSDVLSRRASELCNAAEQAVPLVAQFSSLNSELNDWLTAAEEETGRQPRPTLDRDNLREQQEAAKLLQQDTVDKRPVVERLNKVAPSLIKLCDRAEAMKVQQALDNANERYHSVRLAARERSQRLAADEQRLSELSDRLTTAQADLAAVEERLVVVERSEPVAARPDRLREQLEASAAVVAEMERKLAELQHVRSSAASLLLAGDGSSTAVDVASQAMQQKFDAMIEMYSQVKRAAQERTSALKTTLQASEVFWDDLNDLKLVLNELHDSFDNDDGVVLDPVVIGEEKAKLEAMTSTLNSANSQVDSVIGKGERLHTLVGDAEKPEIGSVLTDVKNDYADLQRRWKDRYDTVQAALNRVTAFQTQLGGLNTWIQYAESKIAELSSAKPSSDIDAVKAQIEAVNSFTAEVNAKYVAVESLNQEANVLSSQSSDKSDQSVKGPLSQLNTRWQSLLDAIGAKKSQLQNTLLSLGQFQSAVEELEHWLRLTEQIVAEEQAPALMYGDAKVLEIELAKQKILLNDVQAHQSSLEAINAAARQIVAAESAVDGSRSGRSTASQASTRERIAALNSAWDAMIAKTKAWEKALEESMQEAQAFRDDVNSATGRLNEILGSLGVTKPIGGLPETAREQLEEFMVIYRELEAQLQPRVGALIEKGEGLLGRCEEASRAALSQHVDQLQNTWDAVSEKAMEKKDKLEGAVEQADKFQQDFQAFVGWLTRAEKALSALPPAGRVLDTLTAQKEEHRAVQDDIATMREAMTALDRTGTHLKYFSQKQDVTLIRNLLASVQQRWERVLAMVAERSRQLEAGWRDAKSCHEQWSELCRWLEESERQLEAAAAAAGAAAAAHGADPARIREELAKHKEFQRLLGSKQPSYDAVCRFCKELKERLGSSGGGGAAGVAVVESDGRVIDTMLSTLKAAWVSVCGKSVDRQRQLEEALLISGQFREALQALLDWLCRVEPMFGDVKCIHGDVDTVSRLVDQHEVFMQELGKRGQTLQSVRKTAKDIVERSSMSGATAAGEIQAQIVELNASWDKVGRLADKRKEQLDEALAVAEDFSRRAHAFLDWVSENEGLLRYYGDIADDEQGVRQQLDAHRIKYKEEIESQRAELRNTLRIGEAILSQCHQDAIPVMKQWMTILNTRFDEVNAWCQQKEERLQEALDTLHSTSELLDELLGWLNGAESALVAMANDALPPDPETLEEMLLEHDDFESEMSARQSDVNMLVKGATLAADGRKSSLGNLLTSPGGGLGSSGRITPSGRRSTRPDQPGARRTSTSTAASSGESTIRNPRVQALSLKWRQVWLMAIDRRRLLQDSLELQRERARLRNFNFEDWRRRYMEWMNHNKTRVMDFFRRMDKDRDGKVTRQEFISGIMQSKFPTSELELEAVANIFDVTGEGFIDYREFMVALRGEGEKEADAKKTDAERITDEVARQCSRCCCVKRYEIQKVADNKYTFGDTQKLRLVRILRSTVMVRVGGGWTALDEFLVKNDPCRARGRTNTELREKFILSENVVGQSMSGFTARGPSGSRLSLSRSTTPAALPSSHSPSPSPLPHLHGSHYHQSPSTSMATAASTLPQRGVTPDREVYQIMSMNRRYTSPNVGGVGAHVGSALSPANGHSLSSSRASSRGAASDDGLIAPGDGSSSNLTPQSQHQPTIPHTPSSASRLPVPTGGSGSSRIPIVRGTPRT